MAVCAAFVMLCSFAFAKDKPQGNVGVLSLARFVSIARDAGGTFASVKENAGIWDGSSIRTDRRGFGEITFNDDSILRLSERTEMVVQDVNKLRKMRLQRGALWLRVTKGVGTSIQTPVASATVRGTEFTIDDAGNLRVIEGDVWFEAGGEGIMVFGGESAGVGPDGKPVKQSDQDLGVKPQWWLDMLGHVQTMPSVQQIVALTTTTLAFGNFNPGSPVPEPATMLVLSLGIGFAASRRAKRPKLDSSESKHIGD